MKKVAWRHLKISLPDIYSWVKYPYFNHVIAGMRTNFVAKPTPKSTPNVWVDSSYSPSIHMQASIHKILRYQAMDVMRGMALRCITKSLQW